MKQKSALAMGRSSPGRHREFNRDEAPQSAAVRAATVPSNPTGCMVTAGALNYGAEYQAIASTHTELRNACCREFAQQLRQATARGELPPDTDTDATSRYIATLFQGIATQPKDGASPVKLFALADVATSHWSG